MRQKPSIVIAFQHDPELAIMDEPTEGLDPLMQHSFFDILSDFRGSGGSIFLSSHILTEIERMCDRVAIIRSGKLMAIESVADLRRHKLRRMELSLSREFAWGPHDH